MQPGKKQPGEEFMPRWTQTGPMYDKDKGKSGGQRVIGTTSTGAEVSVPHLPYEFWMDPAGNVVALCVSTNRRMDAFNEQYAMVQRKLKAARGWVPWDADDAMAHLRKDANGTLLSREEWATYRYELQAQRQAAHRRQTEQWSTQNRTEIERAVKALMDERGVSAEHVRRPKPKGGDGEP